MPGRAAAAPEAWPHCSSITLAGQPMSLICSILFRLIEYCRRAIGSLLLRLHRLAKQRGNSSQGTPVCELPVSLAGCSNLLVHLAYLDRGERGRRLDSAVPYTVTGGAMTTNPDSGNATSTSAVDLGAGAGGIAAAIGSAMVSTAIAFRTRLKLKPQASDSDAVASPPAASVPVIAAATRHRDDLTLITGISNDLARDLAALGVTTFASIAAWRREDVRRVGGALGLGRAISRQNWIEQAALLVAPTTGRPSPVASRLDWRDLAAQPPQPVSVEPPAEPNVVGTQVYKPVPPSPVPATSEIHPPVAAAEGACSLALLLSHVDRLEFIRGMDHGSEAMLRAAGITRPSDIARWTSADVRAWRHRLGAGKRISADGWIEQAALLAAGGETAHARRQFELSDVELIRSPPLPHDAMTETPLLLTRLVVAASAQPAPADLLISTASNVAPSTRAPAATDQLRAIERLAPIAQLLSLPPLPLAPAVSAPCAIETLAPATESVPGSMPRVAAADLETSDIVIIVKDKFDRPRPPSLFPKRSRPAAQTSDRRKTTLTERIETLGQSRPPAAPRSIDTVEPRDANEPLDLSALDAMDVEFPELTVSEADVVIVRTGTTAAAGNVIAGRMASTVQSTRRRTAGVPGILDSDGIDAATYAAYRDEIVEASVDIVPVEPSGIVDPASDRAGRTRPRNDGIARFFQALAGTGSDPRAK